MNWIKSHKLLTGAIVVGIIILYYVYKNYQSNAATAASSNPASGLPNYVYVGGGGSGSLSPTSGQQIGTDAYGNPIYGNPLPSASTAAGSSATPAATPVVNTAVIPGASPMPVVSTPASQDVSSAVVNSPTGEVGTPSSQFPSASFIGTSGMPQSSPWYATTDNPNPNPTQAQLSAWWASGGSGLGALNPSASFNAVPTPVASPSGVLPYQQYIQNEVSQVGATPSSSPATQRKLTPVMGNVFRV